MIGHAPNTPDRALHTAALEGKRNHETLYGDLARSAFYWRVLCFLLMLVVLWDRIELAYVVNKTRYMPVVMAEHDDGGLRFVGEADATWKPTDRHILDELFWLLQTIRGRTTDAKFDRKLWQRMVDHSTEKGKVQLGEAYQELQKLEAKGRIEVDIISRNKASDGTFDLRWEERRHDINGALVGTPMRFRGLFQVLVALPTTLSGWALNEKGVWLDGWSIAREER